MDREHSLSSSDDEEEQAIETLIPQNETKPPPPRSTTASAVSIFEIGRSAAAGVRRRTQPSRCCIIVVCLFIALIILFFSLDLRQIFNYENAFSFINKSNGLDSAPVRMREAELQSLYLLRNQELGLLKLFNHTISNETRSEILEEIRINREIQKALLSVHRRGNSTESYSNENGDLNLGFDLSGSSYDLCKKVERPANRRTIEWKPNKDQYLFAICLSGQMSNHLICLEKHMFLAALLNRILILPSPKIDYQYDKVLDIEHINKCLGRKVVISFEEFEKIKKGKKVHINKFICYIASPPCFLDEDHIKRIQNLGVTINGKIEPAWPEDVNLKDPKKRVIDDILPKFSSEEEVLAIGDMFYADIENEWIMQPGGPIEHKCETLIQPSKLITLAADEFVQTFMGHRFIALHFRRHGFLKFCNAKPESCFYPIPQAAECITRVVERESSTKPRIYLSTDAGEDQIDLLRQMVTVNDERVPLFRRPEHKSTEKWDAPLYRNHLGGDSQVEAMLDKTICALAKVFIGSSGSTFTEDIFRLRRAWGTANECDQYLCQGELPDFIARQE